MNVLISQHFWRIRHLYKCSQSWMFWRLNVIHHHIKHFGSKWIPLFAWVILCFHQIPLNLYILSCHISLGLNNANPVNVGQVLLPQAPCPNKKVLGFTLFTYDSISFTLTFNCRYFILFSWYSPGKIATKACKMWWLW